MLVEALRRQLRVHRELCDSPEPRHALELIEHRRPDALVPVRRGGRLPAELARARIEPDDAPGADAAALAVERDDVVGVEVVRVPIERARDVLLLLEHRAPQRERGVAVLGRGREADEVGHLQTVAEARRPAPALRGVRAYLLGSCVDFTYSSRSCFASTSPGAPVIRSVPFCVFGKAIDVAQRLGAGEQHREPVHAERDAAVRRRAELERVEQEAELLRASSSEMPSALNTRACTSGSWRRIEPPPISKPLSTRS